MELVKIERSPAIPPSKDYALNLDDGLREIQKLSGSVWTHFNAPDPGVTIFQQIVYGLVDVGYRGSLPMSDLLSDRKGEIELAGQFFAPREILTIEPVTVMDMRMRLLDAFPALKNVWIEPVRSPSLPRGLYRTLLELRDDLKETYFFSDSGTDARKKAVQALAGLEANVSSFLARHRNLCEYFLPPFTLRPHPIGLGGEFHLSRDCEVKTFIDELVYRMHSAVFPNVSAIDYGQMKEAGYANDQIFDGPSMDNGYLARSALVERKREIFLDDVASGFSKIEGLDYVSKLRFTGNEGSSNRPDRAKAADDEVLFFPDPMASKFRDQYPITFFKNGMPIDLDSLELGERGYAYNQKYIKHVAAGRRTHRLIEPYPPRGEFRKVAEYSSIQHTFPSLYGIGSNDLLRTASDLRKAQAKQLRAFLMLFEQVIANAFSQLANLRELFSFKKPNKESATYFSQPLYTVPGANELLAGVEKFACPKSGSTVEDRAEAWDRFQKDGSNRYRRGLEDTMKSEQDSSRKRRFLDHQLARVGDSLRDEEKLLVDSSQTLFQEDEIERRARYLSRYPEISSQRGKGEALPFALGNDKDSNENGAVASEPDGYDRSGLEKKLDCLMRITEFYRDIEEALIREARDEGFELADSFDSQRVELWLVDFKDGGQVARSHGIPLARRIALGESQADCTLTERDALARRVSEKRYEVAPGSRRLFAMADGQILLAIEAAGIASEADSLSGGHCDLAKSLVLKHARSLEALTANLSGFVLCETTPLLSGEQFQLRVEIRGSDESRIDQFESAPESLDTVTRLVHVLRDDTALWTDSEESNARIKSGSRNVSVCLKDRFGAPSWVQLEAVVEGDGTDGTGAWTEAGQGDLKRGIRFEIVPKNEALARFSPCDGAFPMALHFYFPDWVARFLEPSMKTYLKEWIRRNAPVHLKTRVDFLNREEMHFLLKERDAWRKGSGANLFELLQRFSGRKEEG